MARFTLLFFFVALAPNLLVAQASWELFDGMEVHGAGGPSVYGDHFSEGDSLWVGPGGYAVLVSGYWEVLELTPGVHVLPPVQGHHEMLRRNEAQDFFEDRIASPRTGAVVHGLPNIEILYPPKRYLYGGEERLGLVWKSRPVYDSVLVEITFSNIFDEVIYTLVRPAGDQRATLAWSDFSQVLDSLTQDSVIILGIGLAGTYREASLGIFLSPDEWTMTVWDASDDMTAAQCLTFAMWLEENYGPHVPWVAYFYARAAELSDRFRYQEWREAYQRRAN